MTFAGVRPLAKAYAEDGAAWQSNVFKTSGPSPGVVGRWCDMSMGAGTPVYNAYVGDQAVATPIIGTGNRGAFTGPAAGVGKTKHLLQLSTLFTQNVTPVALALVDLLMVYPLIDGDSTDAQDLDNTLTLPRYASGAGVNAFLVCTTPMTVNGSALLNYTDSTGAAKALTVGVMGANANVGQIVHTASIVQQDSARTAFLPLPTGIRSVERVTNLAGLGGFYAIVLCKVMAHQLVREQNVRTEHNLLAQKAALPVILPGAYLNFVAMTGGTGALAPMHSELTFTWG